MDQPIEDAPANEHDPRRHLPLWLRLGDPPPNPAQAIEALQDLVDFGLPGYCEPRSGNLLDRLHDRLDGEGRRLLKDYEEHCTDLANAWADDRFRLGYILGLSGLLALIDP